MPSIFDFTDFSGGFCTDVPDHLMRRNELLEAVNVEWDNGMPKRAGTAKYADVTASSILGQQQVYMSGVWYKLIAVKTASGTVEFHYGLTAGSGFSATIPYPSATGHNLTGTGTVRFAVLNEKVVAVNGVDDPRVVYQLPSASIVVRTLDAYDTRDRDDLNWSAGKFSVAAATFTDDTSDAQSSTSADFSIGSTASSGFFIGCDYTFNKIVIKDIGATQSASMAFEYYGLSTAGALTEAWIGVTPLATVTFSVTGDKTVEWDFPIGSDGTVLPTRIASTLSTLDGKYAFRGVLNDTLGAEAFAQGLSAHHTQYITQLFLGDVPNRVVEHKNHIFMGSGNWMRNSPANSLLGWRYQDYHYFQNGGTIQSIKTHNDYLLVLLEGHKYGITGNSWANWVLVDMGPGGAIAPDATIIAKGIAYYVARDGIYSWDGARDRKVSKHIQTEFDTYTNTDAVGILYADKCLLSFPTNDVVLRWDPDSYQTLPDGDARVGFFKWTNYEALYWSWDRGAGDTGYLLAAVNGNGPWLLRCETGVIDFYASATQYVDGYAATPYNTFGRFLVKHRNGRFRVRVTQVSVTSMATYIVSFLERQYGASSTVSFSTSIGTGIHEEALTVPYTMDGVGLSIKIRHKSSATAKFLGFAVENDPRRF